MYFLAHFCTDYARIFTPICTYIHSYVDAVEILGEYHTELQDAFTRACSRVAGASIVPELGLSGFESIFRETFGILAPSSLIRLLFHAFDTDLDARLSLDEFTIGCAILLAGTSEHKQALLWRMYDAEKKGHVKFLILRNARAAASHGRLVPVAEHDQALHALFRTAGARSYELIQEDEWPEFYAAAMTAQDPVAMWPAHLSVALRHDKLQTWLSARCDRGTTGVTVKPQATNATSVATWTASEAAALDAAMQRVRGQVGASVLSLEALGKLLGPLLPAHLVHTLLVLCDRSRAGVMLPATLHRLLAAACNGTAEQKAELLITLLHSRRAARAAKRPRSSQAALRSDSRQAEPELLSPVPSARRPSSSLTYEDGKLPSLGSSLTATSSMSKLPDPGSRSASPGTKPPQHCHLDAGDAGVPLVAAYQLLCLCRYVARMQLEQLVDPSSGKHAAAAVADLDAQFDQAMRQSKAVLGEMAQQLRAGVALTASTSLASYVDLKQATLELQPSKFEQCVAACLQHEAAVTQLAESAASGTPSSVPSIPTLAVPAAVVDRWNSRALLQHVVLSALVAAARAHAHARLPHAVSTAAADVHLADGSSALPTPSEMVAHLTDSGASACVPRAILHVWIRRHAASLLLFDVLRAAARVDVGVPPASTHEEVALIQDMYKPYDPQAEYPAGTLWYVAPASWWQSWTEAVRFDHGAVSGMLSSGAVSSALPRLAADADGAPAALAGAPPRENSNTGDARPALGPIPTHQLVRPGSSKQLHANLARDTEYVLLTGRVWVALAAWYGVQGPELPRYFVARTASDDAMDEETALKLEAAASKNMAELSSTPQLLQMLHLGGSVARPANDELSTELELYPLNLWVQLHGKARCAGLQNPQAVAQGMDPATRAVPDTGQLEPGQTMQRMECLLSKCTTLHMFKGQLQRLYSVPPGWPCRMWYKSALEDEAWLPLPDSTIDVEAAQLVDGGEIMLELAAPDNTWFLEGWDSLERPGSRRRRLRKSKAPPALMPGRVGLANIGNTCYLNSAVQALSAVPQLRDFLLHRAYQQNLNIASRMGSGGRVAVALADLLELLWQGHQRTLAPRTLHKAFATALPRFDNADQQDAQEALAELISVLHEDLNLVQGDKPYIEQPDSNGRPDSVVAAEWWHNHLARDRSVIQALFTGQFKSTLICDHCGYTSARFEPFSMLPLALREPPVHVVRAIVNFAGSIRRPMRVALELPLDSKVDQVKAALLAMQPGLLPGTAAASRGQTMQPPGSPTASSAALAAASVPANAPRIPLQSRQLTVVQLWSSGAISPTPLPDDLRLSNLPEHGTLVVFQTASAEQLADAVAAHAQRASRHPEQFASLAEFLQLAPWLPSRTARRAKAAATRLSNAIQAALEEAEQAAAESVDEASPAASAPPAAPSAADLTVQHSVASGVASSSNSAGLLPTYGTALQGPSSQARSSSKAAGGAGGSSAAAATPPADAMGEVLAAWRALNLAELEHEKAWKLAAGTLRSARHAVGVNQATIEHALACMLPAADLCAHAHSASPVSIELLATHAAGWDKVPPPAPRRTVHVGKHSAVRVKALHGAPLPGSVHSVHSDGTYSVELDSGGVVRVKSSEVEVPLASARLLQLLHRRWVHVNNCFLRPHLPEPIGLPDMLRVLPDDTTTFDLYCLIWQSSQRFIRRKHCPSAVWLAMAHAHAQRHGASGRKGSHAEHSAADQSDGSAASQANARSAWKPDDYMRPQKLLAHLDQLERGAQQPALGPARLRAQSDHTLGTQVPGLGGSASRAASPGTAADASPELRKLLAELEDDALHEQVIARVWGFCVKHVDRGTGRAANATWIDPSWGIPVMPSLSVTLGSLKKHFTKASSDDVALAWSHAASQAACAGNCNELAADTMAALLAARPRSGSHSAASSPMSPAITLTRGTSSTLVLDGDMAVLATALSRTAPRTSSLELSRQSPKLPPVSESGSSVLRPDALTLPSTQHAEAAGAPSFQRHPLLPNFVYSAIQPLGLQSHCTLAVDWDPAIMPSFDREEAEGADDHASMSAKRGAEQAALSLQSCLDVFARPEHLDDESFCSACSRVRVPRTGPAPEPRSRTRDAAAQLARNRTTSSVVELDSDDTDDGMEDAIEFRKFTKTLEVWGAPPVLVVHLKRFKQTATTHRKLSNLVQFPLTGLCIQSAMAKMPAALCAPQLQVWEALGGKRAETAGKVQPLAAVQPVVPSTPPNAGADDPPLTLATTAAKPQYDCAAVVCHKGALAGGHYVAYTYNQDSHSWFCFNDSVVTRVQDPEKEVVNQHAYLLFYIRRDVQAATAHELLPETLRVHTGVDVTKLRAHSSSSKCAVM